MSHISRIPVPSLPNGRVQRRIPTPFQRPSVGILATKKREWRTILACDIEVGDIVPGIGRVICVRENVTAPDYESVLLDPHAEFETSWTITVIGGDDNERVFDGEDQVMVFTTEPAQP